MALTKAPPKGEIQTSSQLTASLMETVDQCRRPTSSPWTGCR